MRTVETERLAFSHDRCHRGFCLRWSRGQIRPTIPTGGSQTRVSLRETTRAPARRMPSRRDRTRRNRRTRATTAPRAGARTLLQGVKRQRRTRTFAVPAVRWRSRVTTSRPTATGILVSKICHGHDLHGGAEQRGHTRQRCRSCTVSRRSCDRWLSLARTDGAIARLDSGGRSDDASCLRALVEQRDRRRKAARSRWRRCLDRLRRRTLDSAPRGCRDDAAPPHARLLVRPHVGVACSEQPRTTATEAATLSTPPSDSGSFTTVMTAFPTTTARTVGGYPLASRLLAATGRTVFLQKTFGASDWLSAATLDSSDPAMDPAFLAITPNGEQIALGGGLSKPLYIFPTSLLSVATPVVLTTSSGAHRYDLPYYSGAFRDNRYLHSSTWAEPSSEQSFIEVIDTDSPTSNATPVIANIPGASGGITFDAAGDLVTGIGWDSSDTRTGEIALFDSAAIDTALTSGTSLDYDTDEHVVATGLLSADSLGFDVNRNLW